MNIPGFTAEAGLAQLPTASSAKTFPGASRPYVRPAAVGLAAFCNKKIANARCVQNPQGIFECETGFPKEVCWEDCFADLNNCPVEYAACDSRQGFPLCSDCD